MFLDFFVLTFLPVFRKYFRGHLYWAPDFVLFVHIFHSLKVVLSTHLARVRGS